MPQSRSYGQFCAIARSLDILGERWTLLIIRELLTGPKRFKALLENLRGMGTNLLTKRLKTLQEAEIIIKSTIPPHNISAYKLTEHGKGLEPVLISLIQWGSGYLATGPGDDYVRAGWAILGLKGLFNPENAKDIDLTTQFEIFDPAKSFTDIFQFTIKNETLTTYQGTFDPNPDLIMKTDLDIFNGLGTGSMDINQAIQSGKVTFDGELHNIEKMFSVFTL